MEKRIIEYKKEFDIDVKKFIECIYVGEYNMDVGIDVIQNEDIYADYLENGGNFWIALDENNNVIGTIAGKVIDNETIELKRMYVRKECRGYGIAQELLNNLEKFAADNGFKYLILGTYERMERAIGFYTKNLFILEDVETEYQEERFFKKCLA